MGVLALVLGAAHGHRRACSSGRSACWRRCSALNNAFENPTRQAFMLEMVGPEHLRNAVSLNSVLVNVARAVGPAVAGILIATVGVGVCFLVNAASFVAVIASLLTLDRAALRAEPARRRASRGQLREGLRYVARTPELARPAADDGAGRHARLRVPGRAAGHGARGVPRRRRGLRLHDRRDGRRRGRRRACSSPRAAAPGCAPLIIAARRASASRSCSPRSRRRCRSSWSR